jgi:hypothetical protein
VTRHIVAYEGKAPFPGTFIEKGALKPADRPIMVYYGMSEPSTFIGKATDFQRDEETGAISFEIEFRDSFIPAEEDEFSAYVGHVVSDIRNDVRYVTDGLIQGIQYIPFGGIPKAFAKNT